MEIRNNTQSQTNFGMAFLKPDDMQSFTKYVTKNRKASVVKKGIEQIRREQMHNKHFDIKYSNEGDEIILIPKTLDAQAVATAWSYKGDVGGRLTPLKQARANIDKELALAKENGSSFKAAFVMGKALINAFKAKVMTRMNPKYSLPKNLIFAAEDATALEKVAEKRIKEHNLIEKAFKD